MNKKLLENTLFLGTLAGFFGILVFIGFLVLGLFGGALSVDPLIAIYSGFSMLGVIGVAQVKKKNKLGSALLLVSTVGMYLSLSIFIVPVVLMGLATLASVLVLFGKE